MTLICLTASHRDLDLDTLERLSAGSEAVGRTVVRECGPVRGAVVVATCNRFELYLDLDGAPEQEARPHAVERIAGLVAEVSGVPAGTAASAFQVRWGEEVPGHLFSVVAGLESMVLGEREITGQVRRALARARDEGTTTKELEKLFQTAARVAKQVASQTRLGATGRSLVTVALEEAALSLPPWPRVTTLLIGTGSYAGATIAALRQVGAGMVRVYSPSGRAAGFAESHDATAIEDTPPALTDALGESDLVIAVSGARGRRGADEADPAYIITPDIIDGMWHEHAEIHREGRPLVILDLALHRDVDPALRDHEDVRLLTLDDLGHAIPEADHDAVEAARAIVAEAADSFAAEQTVMSQTDVTIAALAEAAEREIAAEVDAAIAQWKEHQTTGPRERAIAGEHSDDERSSTAAPSSAVPDPDPDTIEALAQPIRRRIRAELHAAIVAARENAVKERIIGLSRSSTSASGPESHSWTRDSLYDRSSS
ncbi:MAG: glutamyl-tRNA reductase [Propionibacteriaceae bacterium]|nr:glutamyl-tRNA reductase [Propionibacteriaceae bacterium]